MAMIILCILIRMLVALPISPRGLSLSQDYCLLMHSCSEYQWASFPVNENELFSVAFKVTQVNIKASLMKTIKFHIINIRKVGFWWVLCELMIYQAFYQSKVACLVCVSNLQLWLDLVEFVMLWIVSLNALRAWFF